MGRPLTPRRGQPSITFTDDDRLILEWLDLVPASTYEQLSRATGRSVDALRHRLPRLEAAGHVRRELVRQGHRSTAWWYQPQDELAMLLRGATGAQSAESEQVDPARAVVATAALLPHFTAADPSRTIHRGRDVAKIIDRFIFTLQLREAASQSGGIRLGRLPDYLVHDGHRWIAIELRLAAPAEDWASRLETYRRLGVTQVEVHTDHPLLAHILGRLGDRAETLQVRARFWPTTEIDQSA